MQRQRFREICEERLPATLEFLRAMVATNSFTANAAGVNAVGDLVAEGFAPLGFAAERVPVETSASDPRGAHVFLATERVAGRPTVALVSHLDTVFPPEEERRNDFAWRREGRRIYGPGTNDIKGGTAMIHLVLTALREGDPAFFAGVNWVVALNACEEVDSAHFGATCRRLLPADTRAALLFEADGGAADDWALVAARKGRATFTVRVEGRGAHAGGGHAHGVNAIVQLAQTVSRMAALTDYEAGLTVNVGTIAGGTVNNRVPHEAVATLEMRAFDPAVFARAKADLQALAGEGDVRGADGHPCRIEVTSEDECAPWPVNAATEGLLRHWQSVGRELGMPIRRQERGGLSDGNVLWSLFPTLDGLGPRGEHSHCSERSADGSKVPEWVDAESFGPKAALNAIAIRELLGD